MFKKGYIPWNKGKKGYTIKSTNSGINHWRWNGGKTKKNGYIYVKTPNHPRSFGKSKYFAEHILVMEKYLNRYLDPRKEVVHHINRDRSDNRIENLQLIPKVGGAILNAECPNCYTRFSIR